MVRYREQMEIQRRNNPGRKGSKRSATVRTTEQERNALRTAYFKEKAKGYRQTAAWRRLDA